MAAATMNQPKLEELLRVPPQRTPKRRRLAYAIGIIGLLIAGVIIWRATSAAKPAAFTTAKVHRQTISKTVSATGTLQAVTTVQVGTQVSGTISELDADFNTHVHKGQVIARLDPSQLQAQLAQASATLLSAEANQQAAQSNVTASDAAVQSAQANVGRNDAAVKDAQATADRTKKMVDAGVTPAMQLPTAQTALAEAAAQLQQAQAQLNQSKAQAQASRSQVNQIQAQVAQARASVDLAQVNLSHAVIQAPIDGVVVARNVDVGQTVAASLQAPTIFLIANDLTRMEVLANIDEADVGQLKQGAPVSFTVDAYPADVFRGTVTQVRLAPTTVQNVVTYTAVIDVANPELKLKPGMTANVTATVAQDENVLAVPTAALRFQPDSTTPPAPALQRGKRSPQVWRLENGVLKPVNVQTGLTDGSRTEIVSGGLKEGDEIAISSNTVKAQPATQTKSPFAGGGGGGRGPR